LSKNRHRLHTEACNSIFDYLRGRLNFKIEIRSSVLRAQKPFSGYSLRWADGVLRDKPLPFGTTEDFEEEPTGQGLHLPDSLKTVMGQSFPKTNILSDMLAQKVELIFMKFTNTEHICEVLCRILWGG
jgi:hypothetical protein